RRAASVAFFVGRRLAPCRGPSQGVRQPAVRRRAGRSLVLRRPGAQPLARGRARGLLQKGWHVIAETDGGARAVLALALRPGRARLRGLARVAVDAIGLGLPVLRTTGGVALRRALAALRFGRRRLTAACLPAIQRTLRGMLGRRGMSRGGMVSMIAR